MSWSVYAIGTPAGLAKRIEEESQRLTGQSKDEFDMVKPFLVGLVKSNFNEGDKAGPVLNLQASGSGMGSPGKVARHSCSVKIDVLSQDILI